MAEFIQPSTNISAPVIGATAGVALNANTSRVYFQIQNTATTALYLNFGGATASSGNCHETLKAGTTVSDGTGGLFRSSGGVVYTGQIAVGGTAPAFLVYEMAP